MNRPQIIVVSTILDAKGSKRILGTLSTSQASRGWKDVSRHYETMAGVGMAIVTQGSVAPWMHSVGEHR